MRKILTSLLVIAVTATLAYAATNAFFSDKEESYGNTFKAGSIDLTIGSQCSYNGSSSTQCGVWQLKDLNATADKFFNFTDIKPGDWGTNTISLNVVANDAYGCFYVSPIANNENSCTESEKNAEPSCQPNGVGELAQNVEFFAWEDTNNDGVWNGTEPKLFTNTKGPASDVLAGKTYFLGTITDNSTRYIGLQWCAGTMTVNETEKTITCSGSSMGNDVQSDSMSANIAFYVEQTRNNSGFTCPANPFPTPPTP